MDKTQNELQLLVEELINKASEGSYWDFKQCWHSNNAELLKDIVCMANNTTSDMQDGYIIFGVENEKFNVTGVSEDSNRKNQENIIGILSSKAWSGEEIPDVDVKTVEIDEKEVDVLIIYNNDVTPYYLLKDYPETINSGNKKKRVSAGVIYSRVGDRNTSSGECANKKATEFLWKKRFGLVGSDNFKVAKRLENVDAWYSTDDFDTFYNYEYSDITIRRNNQYKCKVELDEGKPETDTWVNDFPYLFADLLNWNTGGVETVGREKWDIFLSGRKLDISLFGVRATRQTYCHIEPERYDYEEYKIRQKSGRKIPIRYFAYTRNSVKFLAYTLFFSKECCQEEQIEFNKVFTVIPVFNNEQERKDFINYVETRHDDFIEAVETQNIDAMFPSYSQAVDSVIVYKFGKTLVQWLYKWR
ncbi:MAG: helix-turn-helix domain-containing protein [Fastidiosipilaceae bacterium]|jgi:hypothetical protein